MELFTLRQMLKRPDMASWLWLVLLVSSLTESEPSLTFHAQPTSQTVKEGSLVTLKCGVQSHSRKIAYEWNHNNKTIRTDKQPRFTIRSDGSLRITEADLDDSGTYQCIALATAKRSNIVRKKAKSRIAKLTVEGMCGAAVITTRPVHTTKFTVGTNMSLRCRCRSSSTGTVRWIKNGDAVSPVNSRISMDHRKLNINGTRFTDSGNYTCYVTIDKLGTAKSEKLEIWVGSRPQINEPPPTSSQAADGQMVLLDCLANGIPSPHVNWYYIGPVWSEHVKNSIKNDSVYRIYDNGTLVIRNVRVKNTGFYECVASNIMGVATRKSKIYIPIEFITKPKNTTVAVGKSTVLGCNATGTPEPVISWDKEKGVKDSKRFIQLADGHLLIRDARMTDAGQYLCIAANKEDLKEAKVTLKVIESDVIKLSHTHKHSIEAFLGARRKITCKFHGSPPVKVTWSKKGSAELPARVEKQGNTLLIRKVILSDAGQYICNGSNDFSFQTTYVNVSVYDPLKFVREPKNQTASVGDSVWFDCEATGSPRPRITWLKYDQGRRPLDEKKYKTHKNGTLHIRNVQYNDAGRYFCIAATLNDFQQRTVLLQVKEQPKQNVTKPDLAAISDSSHMVYSQTVLIRVITFAVITTMASAR